MDRTCPSEQEIDDFLSRRMDPGETASLELHLDACGPCHELVSTLLRSVQPDSLGVATTVPRSAMAAAGSDDPSELIGARIGRYEVTGVLGAGAMGIVYAAHDPGLDRGVALKLLRDSTAASVRLVREGQALGRLSHPNVVAVHDVGEHDGHVFIAMEMVSGTTLSGWLADRSRPRDQVLDIFLQAGRGLDAVHRAGFVHRDFKPDNVLIGRDGRARVTDFGLARLADTPGVAPLPSAEVDQLTRTGALIGTPAYMAPEQLDGRPADARADQFSFCVALFQGLCGVRPFGGDTVGALRASIAANSLHASWQRLPAWLARAIRRGLAEEPNARFSSIGTLLQALERGPGLRKRRVAIASALAVAAGTAALVLLVRAPAPSPCETAKARLSGIWDGARKRAIRDALLGTGQPYAADAWRNVEQALDRYTSTWIRLHNETCRATHVLGEQSEELLDLKMSCLTQRLDRVRALADTLATADPGAPSAVNSALALEPLESCTDPVLLRAVVPPPDDPAERARLDAARRQLHDANAVFEAGNTTRAHAMVTALGELGFAPLDAERWLLLGKTERAASDFEAALAAFRASAREADRSGADATRVAALVELIDVVGVRLGRNQQALEIAKDAAALIARTRVPLASARLSRARAVVLGRVGRYSEATRDLRRALADFERVLGPDHPLVATTCNNLAGSLLREGSIAEAMVLLRRAHAIRTAVLGPLHPDTIVLIGNIGLGLALDGDHAGAETALRRALVLSIAAQGDEHYISTNLRANLGRFLREQKRPQEALAELEIVERRHAARYRESFHSDYVEAIALLANTYLDLGRAGDAMPLLEKGMRILATDEGDPSPTDWAAVRFALARATWDIGGDRDSARAHANWARDVWAGAGRMWAADLAEATAWLQARSPGSSD